MFTVILLICVLGIGALIGGYYFIKNFEKINVKYFDSSSDSYEPFDFYSVVAAALIGAIYMIGGFFSEILGIRGAEMLSMNMGHAFIVLLAVNLYFSFAHMKSWRFRFAKFGFMVIACLIAALVGIIGSAIIICAIAIYLAVLLLSGALRSGGASGGRREGPDARLDDGTELEDMGGQQYRDAQGRTWDRHANGTATRVD